MVVEVPLCRRHRHHWLGRQLLILGSLLALLLVVFVTPALLPPRAVGEWYFLLIPFGLLAWLILVVIVNQGMIRPREITEDSIGLQGVSKAFKEALTEWRREADEQEWEERERRDAPRRPITAEDRERYPDAFEEDRPRRPRDQYRTGEP
jgi:hypothetical protein